MRQLQLIAHGEPSDVIELNAVHEPAFGQEDVLISMEAAPLNLQALRLGSSVGRADDENLIVCALVAPLSFLHFSRKESVFE